MIFNAAKKMESVVRNNGRPPYPRGKYIGSASPLTPAERAAKKEEQKRKRREASARYRKKYPAKARERIKKWRQFRKDNETPLQYAQRKFRLKISNGRQKDGLTVESLEWPTHCPALGVEIDYRSVDIDRRWELDRLDPNGGYTPQNVRIISGRANRIKNNATAAELEQVAAYIRREQEKSA